MIALRSVARASLLCAVSLLAGIALTGCGVSTQSTVLPTGQAHITGSVMGGQQPVGASSIQLYAVGTSGYGSASTPLLGSVQSDSGGSFNITGQYTCPSANSLVYLTATGGNPGIGGSANNSALSLVALLGRCGNLSGSTHVVINEVTTVAAAWALAPFANGIASIGSSATNSTGIANAFAMGANLASSDRGQSPGDAPAGSSIPNAEIDTLANILAACINSTGPSSSACASLFTNTTVNGTAPTETFGAALNIAKNPGSNVAALYNISTSTGPFQPALSSAPNDWTVAAAFAAGSAVNLGIAIDAGGNVLLVNNTALTRLTPAGAVSGSSTAAAGYNVAVDAGGTVWVGSSPSTSHPTLNRLNSDLSVAGTSTFGSVYSSAPYYDFGGFAFDASGNSWFTCGYCSQVTKADSTGALVGSYARGGFHGLNIAIDPGGNVWSADMDGDKMYRFTNTGSAATGSPFGINPGTASYVAADAASSVWYASGQVLYRVTASGTSSGFTGGLPSTGIREVALDGAGSVWVISANNAPSLTSFDSSGNARNSGAAYTSALLSVGYVRYNLAVDPSGSIWLPSNTANQVTVFVGIAAPVVTPLALGVKNGTVASRP